MKVTFPHMGNLYICLKAMLEYLNIEVILPPATSKKTLTLGTQHAPEFACLPLKVNLGNFIEAYEFGADTILMAGGVGPCRFGYYAQIQKEILKDLGYKYNMVVLEPPQKHISELLKRIREITGHKPWVEVVKAIRHAWYKAKAIDEVEMWVQKIRPRELNAGEADNVYKQALMGIDQAQNKKEIIATVQNIEKQLNKITINKNKDVLKIGLVGEIFVLLEPFVNLDIEKQLGRLGAETERSIILSEWINENLFLGLMKVRDSKSAKAAASPFINHFVGGHGQETIGNISLFAQRGFDGVIQLAPFTCMPEIVAQSVIPKINRELNIPVFSLVFDEHSGDAGVLTRLEAFVDLLYRKKETAALKVKEGVSK